MNPKLLILLAALIVAASFAGGWVDGYRFAF